MDMIKGSFRGNLDELCVTELSQLMRISFLTYQASLYYAANFSLQGLTSDKNIPIFFCSFVHPQC